MPYNNTPIHPNADVTGTVSLPLARVKKIIHADEDVQNCSNNAAFVIAAAAEMFIRELVERTYAQAKQDKKLRRNIQYKDVAAAVHRNDNLEFLSDIVPRTMTYEKYLEEKARRDAVAAAKEKKKAQETQRTVQSGRPGSSSHNANLSSSSGTRYDPMAVDTEEEATTGREIGVSGDNGIKSGVGFINGDRDVEMRDSGGGIANGERWQEQTHSALANGGLE